MNSFGCETEGEIQCLSFPLTSVNSIALHVSESVQVDLMDTDERPSAPEK